MASSGSRQIDQLVETMANPSAIPQAKQRAVQTLNKLLQSSPNYIPMIKTALRDYGWDVTNGRVTYKGQAVTFDAPSVKPAQPLANSKDTSWSQANAALPDQARPGSHNTSSTGIFGVSDSNPSGAGTGAGGDIYELDPGPGFEGNFESGGAADPNSFNKLDPRYKNSFFSGAQVDSLDELAANPDQAWSLFRMRGGPGGRDLRNSTASIYGENNFRSAMDLAGILGGNGMGPQDTLGFADQMMRSGMRGGGQYVDPAKILNAAFANIGNEPDAFIQQEQIGAVLDALEPYIDPTKYRALQSRVGRVMDEYLAYGLENGTADLSGVLLKMIQNAVGM